MSRQPELRRTGMERQLYRWAAIAAALIVFSGFARTFYLKGLFDTPALSTLHWVHGTMMTLWLGMFIAQVSLVAAGRTDLHRRLGIVGALLALTMIVLNTLTGIDAGRRGAVPPPAAAAGITPLMFMAVPLIDVVVFAVLIGAGLWNRRRRDVHKRLMLLATLGILTPGIARIPLAILQQGGLPAFFGMTILAVLICAAIDTALHRRLHPAFLWGGGLIILSVPLRIKLAGTAVWTQFAGWLIA